MSSKGLCIDRRWRLQACGPWRRSARVHSNSFSLVLACECDKLVCAHQQALHEHMNRNAYVYMNRNAYVYMNINAYVYIHNTYIYSVSARQPQQIFPCLPVLLHLYPWLKPSAARELVKRSALPGLRTDDSTDNSRMPIMRLNSFKSSPPSPSRSYRPMMSCTCVLQCVAVCCSVLQCVEVCCRIDR